MTIICDVYIIGDKTEDGRRSVHYELKWGIPVYVLLDCTNSILYAAFITI